VSLPLLFKTLPLPPERALRLPLITAKKFSAVAAAPV